MHGRNRDYIEYATSLNPSDIGINRKTNLFEKARWNNHISWS